MFDQQKLDELFDAVAQLVLNMLEESGEFFPIGAVLNADGEVQHVVLHDGDEHPESQSVIDGLTEVFQRQAGEGTIIASALAFDARIRSPETGEATDSVVTRIRSRNYARDVILPYSLETKGLFKKTRTLSTGALSAREAEQDVFR